MNPTQVNTFIPLLGAAAYTVLLVVLFARRSQERLTQWLLGYLTVSALWQLLIFLFPGAQPFAFIPMKALLLGTILLGMTTAAYSDWHQQRWLGGSALALIVTTFLDLLLPTPLFVLPVALTIRPTPGGIASLITWVGLSGIIWFNIWHTYRETRLPWHANRLLYWAIALLFILFGEGLLIIDETTVYGVGQVMRFAGVMGLTYAAANYRLFDVRTRLQQIFAFILTILVSTLPAAGLFWLIGQMASIQELTPQTITFITIVLIALALILYRPLHSFFERIIYHYLIGEEFKGTEVVRQYSQAVSSALEVNQLAHTISNTINELLGGNRGALLLVSKNGSYEIDPIPGTGVMEQEKLYAAADSLFTKTLSTRRQPLLQYELDFNPEYRHEPTQEREWIKDLAMDVFVPICQGNQLNGIIALGPKKSRLPYAANELDLLQTLADQTLVALQNARLFSELNGQNEKIRRLNDDLRQQNERLEIMDKVKTDFITIASHELRTPLTQVKGYADILAAMNEENILTREQTREIIGHINRASLQLEKLISAMLDASQLDVNGMRLTFVQTRLDTVLRLVTEPLYQALRERRLTLRIQNVDEIPPIHADFKRLVQAFSNLMGNAVKYTPDGGTIAVTANILPGQDKDIRYVEVIVSDTGIGIDKKYQELIFEKFFRIGDPQLHSTGSTKFMGAGPGLGLPIAKGVIEGHGGRIWVESDGNDPENLPGSKFHVILPVKPKHLSHDNGPTEPKKERPPWLIG
ncbi:MAG: GAF domain-containing protein [Chloroflexi bacterium]|nr:GAF domain-containing protein [Chloroflexota bacterium]MBP8059316.1 GAF domain-containing protein [Chloroflexota bacterium]